MPLIVIDGQDCSGKTTLCKRLCQNNPDYVYVKLPNRSTATGQLIDQFLKGTLTFSPNPKHNERAAQLLFAANNMEQCQELWDLLEQGKTLVVDRYIPSGIVYHSVAQGSNQSDFILNLNVDMPKPDMIIILEVDPVVASKRRTDYGTERNDNPEYQRRIGEAFREYLEDTALFIDASKSEEEVYQCVLSYL